MDVLLLHNEKAGEQDVSGEELVALLRCAGYRPRCESIKDGLDNEELWRASEFVIAAGGDGSVRKVVTRLANTGRPVAPLPLGTANNIATSLGIAGSPAEIIAGWKNAERRPIDLGVATGPWGRRLFVEGIGIGLIGRAISILEQVDAATHHASSSREDTLHRDASVLFALAHECPAVPLDLSIDGRDRSGGFILLEAMNISRSGPGVELVARADTSDGMLDLVTAAEDERGRLIASLEKSISGAANGPILSSEKARTIRIGMRGGELRLDDAVMVTREDFADGGAEARGIEIEISVMPGALEMLVPRREGT